MSLLILVDKKNGYKKKKILNITENDIFLIFKCYYVKKRGKWSIAKEENMLYEIPWYIALIQTIPETFLIVQIGFRLF